MKEIERSLVLVLIILPKFSNFCRSRVVMRTFAFVIPFGDYWLGNHKVPSGVLEVNTDVFKSLNRVECIMFFQRQIFL